MDKHYGSFVVADDGVGVSLHPITDGRFLMPVSVPRFVGRAAIYNRNGRARVIKGTKEYPLSVKGGLVSVDEISAGDVLTLTGLTELHVVVNRKDTTFIELRQFETLAEAQDDAKTMDQGGAVKRAGRAVASGAMLIAFALGFGVITTGLSVSVFFAFALAFATSGGLPELPPISFFAWVFPISSVIGFCVGAFALREERRTMAKLRSRRRGHMIEENV